MSKLNATFTHLKLAWYGLLGTLVLMLLIFSALNSESLSSVSIKLAEGQEEHRDKTIPFVSKPEEALPDYRVAYLEQERWRVIGTAFNSSAKDWLEFEISDPPNLKLVQGIRVTDQDTAQHDHLEEVQMAGGNPAGKMFEYRIETTRSFKAGMDWFATTQIGMVIFGAIGLAVLLVVLSYIVPV